MKVVEKIKKQKNISYLEIAEMLDCSKTFAWQIFNGKRTLSYQNAVLIATIFDMKPDEIFYSEFVDNALREKINNIENLKKEKFKEKLKNIF